MLPSNRRYAHPAQPPRRPPWRRPRNRRFCVTKFPTSPATDSAKRTYLYARNTHDFGVLRHNAIPVLNRFGAGRTIRRKTGTATNSRLWNWLAVPGLPTADTPPVARPIFILPDEAFPHNATDTKFPAQFAGNWLSVPGFAPRGTLRLPVSPPNR
jgi:hypothetical protein